ncbi:Eco57I restriction-modification methylase domain-containing protein [Bdellovibrio svalbardensis]|uniref:site-specific DNA-methyltransferase (adenine-specific) n=1 Tax=Bdellovibrio svalbardensis TaxID=2972972 RepID=A0ABT6DJA3_9BACT|nr:N-6 DNA methylase [Bdellovibrio svalbardensis]MDG0815941.1 N-6 DNA methylase [Bdellovibrio svalbardensis]
MAKASQRERFAATVEKLVRKFDADKEFYMSSEYNESQARLDFIDHFFVALNWDLSNKDGVPYHRRDVIVERGDTTSRVRPDYTFRLSGRAKFFVEAKAPNQPLDNIYHVFQAKSYAWSSPDADVAILTDFERLKVFDCRATPEVDKPNKGLIKDIKYSDFLKEVDFLWQFSKENVQAGSLSKLLVDNETSKKNRVKVDKQFLKFLMEWRLDFANQIWKGNKGYDESKLDEVVDLIVNRIIFLRVAEDREILTRPTLISMSAHWNETKKYSLWEKILSHFEDINDDLNGILFKKSVLTDKLRVPDQLLFDFIQNLYFPNSPYRFDEIPIELLGTIYEQYLGKQFEVNGKNIVLVDKPEVRKAGGVFYTPQNVVDTIVQKTLSEFSKGKKYSELSKISILDPACGSGSFLITAFSKLLNLHLDYLIANPSKVEQGKFFPDLVKDDRGEWKLSIEKKRDILQTNIFGVDIDQQAINICVMSLYLKALEGEQRLPTKKSLLPTLDKNIKCGNSLVSGNTKELKQLIGEDYDSRKPFNWVLNFTKVLKDKNGFDVIIMNPPYVKIQKLLEDETNDVKYIQEKYRTAAEGSADIYVAFIEKSLELLNPSGQLGLICPHKFFQAEYGQPLRDLLSESHFLNEIVSFGDIQIFEKASTYTCLLYCSKQPHEEIKFSRVKDEESLQLSLTATLERKERFEDKTLVIDFVKAKELRESAEWNFVVGSERKPFDLLSSQRVFLGSLTKDIYQGVITGADDAFILQGNIKKNSRTALLRSLELGTEVEVETDLLMPVMQGYTDVKHFKVNKPSAYIILPYQRNEAGKALLIPNQEMKSDYPLTWRYLKENKPLLEKREKGKWAGPDFHCFSRNQNLLRFQDPKIMIPYMVDKLCGFYDGAEKRYFVNVTTGGYGLELNPNSGVSYNYILGLINSTAMNFFIKKIGSTFRGGYFPCSTQFLRKLPIVMPSTKMEKEIVKKIEDLVAAINIQLLKGIHFTDDEVFENQAELDQLVNQLYAVDKFYEIMSVA